MAENNILKLNNTAKSRARKPVPAPQSLPSTRRRLAIAAATAIGAVAVVATALSLSDLAESIQSVAGIHPWKAYSWAIVLDANFVATEAFALFASAAVASNTRWATMATRIITLGMSACANGYAMSHNVDGTWMQLACAMAGFAVPGLIALSTITLGKALRN